MGQIKNQHEERNGRRRLKNRGIRVPLTNSVTEKGKSILAKPAYEKMSDTVLRILFGPKPRTAGAKEMVEKLGGRWKGSSSNVCCPAHNDHTPSLSVTEAVDGGCLLYCHSGCSQTAVINAIITKYGIRPRKAKIKHSTLGNPNREFDYRDRDGCIILKACRFERSDGKTIRYYIPSERKWGLPETRPLYNLPQLIARPEANVLIVEGEKTAEAAQRFFPDYTVTTWPCGANAKLAKIDFSPLKHRNIVIFSDNDDAGRKVALQIQEIVGGEVCFPSPNSPKGWDLADACGEQIHSIRFQLEKYFSRSNVGLSIRSIGDLYEKEIPELAYAVGGLYPEGVTLVAGRPKIGKSFHMCQLCVAVARGDEFLGRPTTKGKVLYISFEDSERRLQKRLSALPRVTGDFFDYALTWPKPSEGGYELLEDAINEHGFKLIVIDTLARFIGINKRGKGAGDGYSDDYEAIGRLVELAHRKHVGIVFVHHLRKAKADDDYFEAVAGSTGLTAAPDTIIVLKKKGLSGRATLMARGRDVPETVLELEMVNGIWENIGDVEELAATSSPIKKRILQALSNKNGQTPAEIAKQIGENRNSVRVYLRKLVEVGKLICEKGLYFSGEEDNSVTV